MKRKKLVIATSMILVTSLSFVYYHQKERRIQKAAEQITWITTTNPIPSIPSTKMIFDSFKSFCKDPVLRRCKKIIVFDGIQWGYEHREKDYQEYKKNIEHLVATSEYFQNTELIYSENWIHIKDILLKAFERVSTPFIFIHQHDFVLLKPIYADKILSAMDQNPSIKYIRLNMWHNLPKKKGTPHHLFDGDVDEVVEGGSTIALTRTFGWSDPEHFARFDYYKDFVMPNVRYGSMEYFLDPLLKKSILEHGKKGHAPFGTYILGSLGDGKHVTHIDGREGELNGLELEPYR